MLDTNQKTAFLFCGQGAQRVGMGKEYYDSQQALFDAKPELTRLCFDGPADELNRTINTQPALFMVSVAHYRELIKEFAEENIFAAAGFSLGEFSALAAAGVMDYDATLTLVEQRAVAMQLCADNRQGAMTAVIGAEYAVIDEVIANARQLGVISVANYNCPGQTVISGEVKPIEAAERDFAERGISCKRLPVSGGFHTELMEKASEKLTELLANIQFNKPKYPILSNVTGDYYGDDVNAIKALLAQQVMSSVKWEDTIRRLKSDGVTQFVEVGVGKTLTSFLKRIK